MRVLIDTDPGIDDSVALAFALRSPELQVAAITTTYGNTTVDRATHNARELLARLGADVTVYPGADRPLVRALAVAADTHGETGLGYAGHALTPAIEEAAVEAPAAILRAAATSPEPLTLICLGPLTNLALALALDRPLLRARVREVVWMGGEPDGHGNITPVSEFNAWSDPEAAQMVVQSGLPLRMVGLNVTRRMVLTRAAVDGLSDHADPAARWWGDMLRFYCEFHQAAECLAGCVVNDPLAVALAFLPDWAETRPMYVSVDRGDGPSRGQTVCDRHGVLGQPPNADVALRVRAADVLALVNARAFGGAIPEDALLRGVALGESL